MTQPATSSSTLELAFSRTGLAPKISRDDVVIEAKVSYKGETYLGYSEVSEAAALRDLMSDLPDELNLRVAKKAGLLA